MPWLSQHIKNMKMEKNKKKKENKKEEERKERKKMKKNTKKCSIFFITTYNTNWQTELRVSLRRKNRNTIPH